MCVLHVEIVNLGLSKCEAREWVNSRQVAILLSVDPVWT